MIESTESKTRDIPIWLTGLVLLLCIGGGGWLIMWYMRDNPNRVVEIPEDKNTVNFAGAGRGAWKNQAAGVGLAGGPRAARINLDADGIQPSGRSSFRVKVGNTVMLVNSSGSNRYDFIPQYLNARTPEEAELTVMRMSLLGDPNWREHLKVTEEQLAQLRNKVPAPQTMKLELDDRNRLATLWKTYQDGSAAVKVEAEKKFLAAVDEIGKKNTPAFKQYEAARAAAIKAALTPEQIKMYRSVGGGKAPAANPKPAAVPADAPVVAPAAPAVPAPAAATLDKK
ncbi:MAG: hypothetical protein JWN40_2362 [Phycisphaerales bacterium]|nr:hypothetical protein [Phycisphaerales bacterium]